MARILIIDDSTTILSVIKEALEKAGYQADTALTGEEGLTKVSASPYDCVIVDTVLPGTDGFQITAQIKKVSPSVAIVMTTGTIDAVDAVKARKSGADDYAVKTLDGGEIVTAVSKLLAQWNTQTKTEKS